MNRFRKHNILIGAIFAIVVVLAYSAVDPLVEWIVWVLSK